MNKGISAAMLAAGLAVSSFASLSNSYQFNGNGNWSLDAVGSNDTPVGQLQAVVPLGSTIEKAFLYSSLYYTSIVPDVTFEGVTYSGADWTNLGANQGLNAFRADVTSQIASLVGGGSASTFNFNVSNENPNSSIDGEVLVIVYSNASESERTIAFLDGFSASGGDQTTFNFSSPLGDPAAPGFEALLSLGIGYGYQPSGQYSQVDIDGRRLTSSAGGQDDGGPYNGGLVTAGGLGDSPTNPDPFVNDASGPRTDDELYNLALGNSANPASFLTSGQTSFQVNTLNPSHDDNIFFLGLNVTARGGVNQPPPDETPAVPEPTTLGLFGMGLIGMAAGFRRRRK